jgi:hypothetical protein
LGRDAEVAVDELQEAETKRAKMVARQKEKIGDGEADIISVHSDEDGPISEEGISEEEMAKRTKDDTALEAWESLEKESGSGKRATQKNSTTKEVETKGGTSKAATVKATDADRNADKETTAKAVGKGTTAKAADKGTTAKATDKATTAKAADKGTTAKTADKGTTAKAATSAKAATTAKKATQRKA